MANILSDNTVIPSYLGTASRGGAPGSDAMLNDPVLRLGEVKAVIYPDDNRSYSKRSVEYEVEVQYREGGGTYTTALYRGVTVSTLFGGVADRFEATMRPDENPHREAKDGDIGTGSKVLLLCVSGDQQKAIILGGLQDPKDAKRYKKDEGHQLFFEFNGLRFAVNKDGEATATFRGATKADGTLVDGADKAAEGTRVSFTKEGNVTVATPSDKQLVRVNHKDKKIELVADQQWHATVAGELKFEVQQDITINSSTGGCSIGVAANIKMTSAGVHVGLATDSWVKGTTYRLAEGVKHSMEASGHATVGAGGAQLGVAGGMMIAAGALMVIPVAGAMIAGPLIAAAGGLLTSGGASVTAGSTTMASALATFEAGSVSYLSPKNLTD